MLAFNVRCANVEVIIKPYVEVAFFVIMIWIWSDHVNFDSVV